MAEEFAKAEKEIIKSISSYKNFPKLDKKEQVDKYIKTLTGFKKLLEEKGYAGPYRIEFDKLKPEIEAIAKQIKEISNKHNSLKEIEEKYNKKISEIKNKIDKMNTEYKNLLKKTIILQK